MRSNMSPGARMKWVLLATFIFFLAASSSRADVTTGSRDLIDTLRGHRKRSPERRDRDLRNRAFLTKREKYIERQLKKISKLIVDADEEKGCSSDGDPASHCKLHWLPDTILRLTSRIASRKSEAPFETKRERKIYQKRVMITKLIENMVTITDCGPEEEEEKKEEKAKTVSKTGAGSKAAKDKKKKDGDTEKGEEDKEEGSGDEDGSGEGHEGSGEGEEEGSGEGEEEGSGEEEEGGSGEGEEGSGEGEEEGSGEGEEEGSGEGEEEGSGLGEEEGGGDDAGEEAEGSEEGPVEVVTAEEEAEEGSEDEEKEEAEEGSEDEEKEEAEEGSEDEEKEKSDCDYASFGPSHTMLLPPNECDIHKTGITEEDKEDILRIHNELRAKVARGEETQGNPGPQPPAANMRELVWNDQLAEVAEAWAKQCKQAHDSPGARKICSRNYFVNQNLHFYYGPSPVVDWESAINAWYVEVADMPAEIASSFRPLTPIKIGHYTQVVWADTSEIGCGIVHYATELQGRMLPESKVYACNYGEAGNVETLPMYSQGPAASQCPQGISENYPDLCV